MNFLTSITLRARTLFGGKASRPASPQGGDFWGVGTEPTPAAASAASTANVGKPPGMRILDLFEPVFLYVCEQNQLFKAKGNSRGLPDFETVRAEVLRLVKEIETQAQHDPYLGQQYQQLKKPLLYYLDYTFSDAEGHFPFHDDWRNDPLAASGAKGNMAGSQVFYDELDHALDFDVNDAAANERLLFYYQCLGLGFLGLYFKPTDRKRLTDYMDRLHGRLRGFLEKGTTAAVLSSETSLHVNRRDLPALVKEKPLIILAAAICLVATLVLGYFKLYDSVTQDLTHAVKNVQSGSSESAAPPAE